MSTTGNKKGQSGSDRGDEMDGSWFIDGDTYSPPSSPSHRQQTRSEPRDEGINPSFTATTSLFCCAQCPLPRSEKGDYFHTFLTALHSVPTNSRSANLFPKFPLLSAKQKDTAPFGRVIEVVTMSPAAMTPQRKYQSYYYVSRSGARGDCKFREVAESDVERWVYGDGKRGGNAWILRREGGGDEEVKWRCGGFGGCGWEGRCRWLVVNTDLQDVVEETV